MPSEAAIQSMDLPRVRKAYAPVGRLLQPHSQGLGKVRAVFKEVIQWRMVRPRAGIPPRWKGVVVYQVVFSVFQKERSPVCPVFLNQESLVDMFCRHPPVIFGEGSMFGSP